MKEKIKSSEWILVGSLLLIMASLVLIAKVNAYRVATTISEKDLKQEEILVSISGAVEKPGDYTVLLSGTTYGEVVRKARPKPFADLKKISLKEPIEAPVSLVIEELTEVKISLRGAVVKPIELTVPAGSRICDLRSKISLTAEADKAFFRRRKLLKEGDVIEVPKKTVDRNSAD